MSSAFLRFALCSKTPLALALILTVLGGVAAIELSAPQNIFAEPDELASFLASAAITGVFSWLFASRNAKQRQQLFLWATRDPLTGLENRRSLDHELDIAVSAARRERRGYGLIIMDTDNFKETNDNLGHAAGTPVTVSVGAALLGDNEDKQSWNRRADRSMYRAKKLGGNRYIVDQLV